LWTFSEWEGKIKDTATDTLRRRRRRRHAFYISVTISCTTIPLSYSGTYILPRVREGVVDKDYFGDKRPEGIEKGLGGTKK